MQIHLDKHSAAFTEKVVGHKNGIKISSRDLGGCVKKLFCLLEFIERTSARIYVWECFFCPVVIGNCLCQLLSAKCHSVFPLLWKHLPLQPLTS